MFAECRTFNGDISAWNVSNVTNMTSLFYNCILFNSNISSWNVAKVVTMTDMFNGCIAFNQPIGKWNVSSVTNMSGMFSGTASFSADIGAWNTKNVTDMTNMFLSATLYNMNFANWNFSKVTAMTGFITNISTGVYNNVKTSLLFIKLNNNITFKNKDIRYPYRAITYLANTNSVQAATSLTDKKGNRINLNPVTPNIATFKSLNYSVADLVSIGYKLKDLNL